MPATIGTTTAAASAMPRPASSEPDGPALDGGAMPELILPGARFGQQAPEERRGDADAGFLQAVGGDGGGKHERCQHDHREDPAMAEEHQSDRPKKRGRGVEDVTGLAWRQPERLQAV